MQYNMENIRNKASYCLNCKLKPCTKGCPLGNNIPDFIKSIKEENYKEAYDILLETTVLQSVCGRICPHEKQCQNSCVRGIKSMPVRIGELEAFVGDMAIKDGYEIKSNGNKNNKKIAVVGGGPSGLTCAAFLARNGYQVTIYEKYNNLGGLLRHGIPEFRLDRNLLDLNIKKILDIGIDVVYNKALGKDYTLKELKEDYDAVFLSFGANLSQKTNIPGEELKGVFGGRELLEENLHQDYKQKRVAVNGGGNVAMDVARTVKRLGAEDVYVIYRRAEEQMSAEKKEIEAAKKEGIKFLFQNNISKIIGNNANEVIGIECIKTELIQKEGEARLIPVNIENSNYNLDIDYVIMAIGAMPEKNLTKALDLKIDELGYIEVDEEYKTSDSKVFAGGDLIGANATVAWAARTGREAAKSIMKSI